MPRFTDTWVVDKVMYSVVSNNGSASCLCCGAGSSMGQQQQLFLFSDGSGFEGIVNAMSDLETREEKDHEISAANSSPWPPDLRDRIWSERLSLRFKMKRERKIYRDFFERVLTDEYENGRRRHLSSETSVEKEHNTAFFTLHEINIQDAIPILHEFCLTELTPTQLLQIFQPLSPSSLVEMIQKKYKVGPEFSAVLCSVKDQVANFKITGYGADAVGMGSTHYVGHSTFVDEDDMNQNYELEFEKKLVFSTKGFYINITKQVDHHHHHSDVAPVQPIIHEEVLLMFLRHMTILASLTTLLSRSVRKNDQNNTVHGEKTVYDEKNESPRKTNTSNPIPSFRSDRRVIRLLIARYWTDRLIEKYDEVQKQKKTSIKHS